MEVVKTNIEGVVILEPRVFHDERGYFFESFEIRRSTSHFYANVKELLAQTCRNTQTCLLKCDTAMPIAMHT